LIKLKKFLLILLILILITWLGKQLYNSHLFDIKEIKITGNRRVTDEKILQLSQIAPGLSLLKISPREIRNALASEVWVKEIEIIRHFPRTLELRVKEREPFASLAIDGHFFLIDQEGVVLEYLKSGPIGPVIRDVKPAEIEIGKKVQSDSLANAIACLENLLPSLGQSIKEISAPSMDDLSFITSEGIRIIYGRAEEMAKKKYILNAILSQAKINNEKIEYIDIRVVSNPVVKKE